MNNDSQIAHAKPQEFVRTTEQAVDYTDGGILILHKATSPPSSVNNYCIVIQMVLIELSSKVFVWSSLNVLLGRYSAGKLNGRNSVIYANS